MSGTRFRWSFVTGTIEPLLVLETARATAQREFGAGAVRPSLRSEPRMAKVPRFQPGAFVDTVPFVVDARGRVVGALGQSHIDADRFIDVFSRSGRLRSMDPLTALGHAWTVPDARRAWDVAVREVLVVQTEAVYAILQRGEAATNALVFERILPGRPTSPGRLAGRRR